MTRRDGNGHGHGHKTKTLTVVRGRDRRRSSWEDLAGDELFMRDCVRLLIEGWSYLAIAQYYNIDYATMLKVAKELPKFISQETRALTAHWQSVEYLRLESVTKRLLPHIVDDPNNADQEPPNPKHIMSYRALVMTKLAVLTLDRRYQHSEPDEGDLDDAAANKAQLVGRYMELADKLVQQVAAGGYGSGRAPDADDDDALADELELNARADNSSSIEDALIIDERGAATDAELESAPGEWRDGKFYPLDTETKAT